MSGEDHEIAPGDVPGRYRTGPRSASTLSAPFDRIRSPFLLWGIVGVVLISGSALGAWYLFDSVYEQFWPMPSLPEVREWDEQFGGWDKKFGGPDAQEPGIVVPPRPDTRAWYEWQQRRGLWAGLVGVVGGIAGLTGFVLAWRKWARERRVIKVLALAYCFLGLAGVALSLVLANRIELFGTEGSPTGIVEVLAVVLASLALGFIGLDTLRWWKTEVTAIGADPAAAPDRGLHSGQKKGIAPSKPGKGG